MYDVDPQAYLEYMLARALVGRHISSKLCQLAQVWTDSCHTVRIPKTAASIPAF